MPHRHAVFFQRPRGELKVMSLAKESLGLDHESRKELKNSRAIQEHLAGQKGPWARHDARGFNPSTKEGLCELEARLVHRSQGCVVRPCPAEKATGTNQK